jgi:lipoprotein-anchoring transpeptidase ErfK/SrfK
MPVTAAAFADFVTDGVATLVASAWLLTTLDAPNAAFTVMLAAGATEAFVLILRIPDAARALRRFRAPAATLAVVAALDACAARRPEAGPSVVALAAERAGPGRGIQPGDTATGAATAIATLATMSARAAPEATLSLRLNIPAYRLDVLADSETVASYGVAIGMRKYRTPTGGFAVYRIVWNPWWIPPDSPWARAEKVTAPGPTNPMGRVKLLIGGPYYLHGTPFATSIGSAASHGCIRMLNDDATALARRLQARVDSAPRDSALAAILADTVSHIVDLPRPIPLHIGYERAEVRGDSLLVHPDVYRTVAEPLRARVMRALVAAGRDTARVRRSVLATTLRRARTRHVAVPLDSVAPAILPGPFILVRTP